MNPPAATFPLAPDHAAVVAPKPRRRARLPWVLITLLILAHLPLAYAMKAAPMLAVAHAWGCLLVGLALVAGGRKRERVAYVAAYLAGAEVLWRMTNKTSYIPWEFGKYSISLLFIIAMVREGRLRIPPLAITYFALLIPSALLTLVQDEWELSRRLVSGNISGPFALMVCYAYFQRLKVTPVQLLQLFTSFLMPVAGVAAVCYRSTFGNTEVSFGTGSNVDTSGGFGPNQVSSTLGLGIIAAFICASDEKSRLWFKLVLLGTALFYATQSALTLSRTGLYLAAGGIAAGAFYLVRSPRTRLSLLLGGVVAALIVNFVLLPRLDVFTGGALSNRFKNSSLTGREEIAKTDLLMFVDNPVTGVGMGQSWFERAKYGRSAPAHTEFTRLLAEHGMLGVAAVGLLLFMGWGNLRRASTLKGKAVATSMLVYTMGFMSGTGMRLVLPAFAFGLAAVVVLRETKTPAAAPAEAPPLAHAP